MPVNLTFAGKAYEDNALLRYGFAFERATENRVKPLRVPSLDSDRVLVESRRIPLPSPPELVVEVQSKEVRGSEVVIEVTGSVSTTGTQLKGLACHINGQPYEGIVKDGRWSLTASYPVSERDNSWKRWTSPATSQTIVEIVAYTDQGSTAGKLILL